MPGMEGLIGALFNIAGKTAYHTARTAWRVGTAVAEPAMKTAFAVGAPAVDVAAEVGSRAASFGLRHPEMTMMGAAGGLAVMGAMALGAEESTMSEGDASELAMATGPSTGFTPGMGSMAYDPNRMRFQDSTMGLVQGLARGRHG